MRFPAARRRIPPKQPPLRIGFLQPRPGMFGIDLGEALAQVMWRELLRENGLRGQV